MPEKQKHIHKLKRLKYKSGNTIFFCALPDCTFKTNPSLALGKRSICWRCGEEFIMNEYTIRLSKPHCDACHKPKVDKSETLEEIPGGMLVSRDIPPTLSLSDRLSQTIQQATQQTTEQEEDEI